MGFYRTVVETDHRLIQGVKLAAEEREEIVSTLLAAAQPPEHRESGRGREMSPLFYRPEAGVKVRSLLGQTPKTAILAGNMVELETLRLLCLLAPDNERIQFMRKETLARLRNTCFGSRDDGQGECFDASLITLRFLCTAAPDLLPWIQDRVDNYNRHADEKKRPWFPLWYFWLCLSEMPLQLALPEIDKHRKRLEEKLRRSYVMNSPQDRAVHPVVLCMLRNLFARLPAYSWLQNREPYINEKDHRLYLPLSPAGSN